MSLSLSTADVIRNEFSTMATKNLSEGVVLTVKFEDWDGAPVYSYEVDSEYGTVEGTVVLPKLCIDAKEAIEKIHELLAQATDGWLRLYAHSGRYTSFEERAALELIGVEKSQELYAYHADIYANL